MVTRLPDGLGLGLGAGLAGKFIARFIFIGRYIGTPKIQQPTLLCCCAAEYSVVTVTVVTLSLTC